MTSAIRHTRIAVLSDTHGLLRPEVIAKIQGVDHILHAGDVGNADFLDQLSAIAPVTAIRGNIDVHSPCADLPATEMVEIAGVTFYLVHSVADLDISPTAAGVRVVISGHSHKPGHDTRNGVLYLNPGSVGPRRFKLPIAMAFVMISEGNITVEPIEFDA
ncbi:phosphoesterase, MJ0936 family [Terriglobus roseus DSM 18391]|uniref:Phosphoesterase n=1 Tax=Terriglobus roseus (strain DSM 18391 / NRRL B-41598 / KBS 63) TaxID=926566 RepID=I3ZEF3_TERRK|nr:metallophosphoesterase family protein [Terriglobus roseus]AFL87621.1 phosphoesterase, MJ0936 family [Terriglobus roseus DSM 18391]